MHPQSTETLQHSTSRAWRNQPNLRTRHCHQYMSRPSPKTSTIDLWKTITKWKPKSPIYSQLIPLSTRLLPLRILLTDPILLSHQNSLKYLATLTVPPNNPIKTPANLSLRRPTIRQLNYDQLPIPTSKPIIPIPLPTSFLYFYRTLPRTTDNPPTSSYQLLNTYRPTAYLPNNPIQNQPNIFLRRPFHRKMIYSLTSPIPISKPSITFQSTSCNIYIYRALPTTSYQNFYIYRPMTRLPNNYLPYPIPTDF